MGQFNQIKKLIDMTTFKELKDEVEKYKNTLVLNYFEVVRLVDVVNGDDDYYWVYDTSKGILHSSCVCGWYALKGVLPDNEYERLVKVWNLNNDEKAV
jgi:hypothetical protein